MAEVAKHNHEETGIDHDHEGREHIPYSSGFIGRISGLIRSQLARVAAGIVLAVGGAGATLSACTSGTNAPNKPAGTYSTQTGALTLDQVLNVGEGQPVPWIVFGNDSANYAEIDGEKYIFVGVDYVKCKVMEDCLSADANIQKVQGLIAAGIPSYITEQLPDGTIINAAVTYTAGAYQDKDGNNKLLVESEGEHVYKCDIAPNANATLEAANCAKADPPMWGDFSVYKKMASHPASLLLYGLEEFAI